MQIEKSSFPNPEINFEGFNQNDIENFRHIIGYLDLVSPYIFTLIQQNQIDERDRLLSWLLRTQSENLLRSIYLRNSFVESVNSKNLAGVYLALKAWSEIAGLIASLLELLDSEISDEDLSQRLLPYVLGNRGDGEYRIGDINAINVMTMLKKADKYLAKLIKSEDSAQNSLYYANFYDVASNPTHPSFDANKMVGKLVSGTGMWEAYSPTQYQDRVCDVSGYRGLLLSSLLIPHMCERMFSLEGLCFNKLGVQYFKN